MTPYRLCVTMAEKKAAATTILVLLSLVVTGAKAGTSKLHALHLSSIAPGPVAIALLIDNIFLATI